jgi:adenylate kinase family enzyme
MDQKEGQVYVISGFPKSLENLEVFNQKMNNMGHVKAFFNFTCSEATMLKRLQSRGNSNDNLDAFK